MKKEIKQKIKKIKDYEISDNKLAALVFIVSIVLGIRAGNYLRLFVFERETKKRKKEQEQEYSNLYSEPEPEDWEVGRSPDDESKGDDDPRAGIGAYDVSLFGKNKNRKFKKVALATLLGGGLGIGTGIYLRDNKIKKERKIEEKERKETEERMKKHDEDFERLQKKLKESDVPEPLSEIPRKKIEFEEFDQEYFDQMNIPFEDDKNFEIKAEVDSGTIGLKEEEDFMRAMETLEKSKKKLKEDKKKTKKKKKLLSSNKDANAKISIINKKIEENEKQVEELNKIYDDYFVNKKVRLTKKDLIRILSREEGIDKHDLKYYSYWELYKMYEEIMEEQKAEEDHQRYIQEILNSSKEKSVQEVMLFGKKKRKRRKKKRK